MIMGIRSARPTSPAMNSFAVGDLSRIVSSPYVCDETCFVSDELNVL